MIIPGKSRPLLFEEEWGFKLARLKNLTWSFYCCELWECISLFSELPCFGTNQVWSQSTEKNCWMLYSSALEMRLRIRIPQLLLTLCNFQQIIHFFWVSVSLYINEDMCYPRISYRYVRLNYTILPKYMMKQNQWKHDLASGSSLKKDGVAIVLATTR